MFFWKEHDPNIVCPLNVQFLMFRLSWKSTELKREFLLVVVSKNDRFLKKEELVIVREAIVGLLFVKMVELKKISLLNFVEMKLALS
jgi:hypothetical protein